MAQRKSNKVENISPFLKRGPLDLLANFEPVEDYGYSNTNEFGFYDLNIKCNIHCGRLIKGIKRLTITGILLANKTRSEGNVVRRVNRIDLK